MELGKKRNEGRDRRIDNKGKIYLKLITNEKERRKTEKENI